MRDPLGVHELHFAVGPLGHFAGQRPVQIVNQRGQTTAQNQSLDNGKQIQDIAGGQCGYLVGGQETQENNGYEYQQIGGQYKPRGCIALLESHAAGDNTGDQRHASRDQNGAFELVQCQRQSRRDNQRDNPGGEDQFIQPGIVVGEQQKIAGKKRPRQQVE